MCCYCLLSDILKKHTKAIYEYSLKDYFPHILQALTGSIWNNIINVELKVSVKVETFAVLHPAQEA